MNRKQINAQWEHFCRAHLPEPPSGFSAEHFLFAAKEAAIPDLCLKCTHPEDRFEKLSFNGKVDFRKKEDFECSESKLKELTEFLKSGQIRFGLGYDLDAEEPFHVIREGGLLKDRDIWFLGDIHGDIVALRSALAFINSNSEKKPVFVFLGDLFDRNLFSLNVLAEVVSLIKDEPDSVFWIAGNDDEGLCCTGDRFSSSVTPQEFTDYLNLVGVGYVNDFIRSVISLIKKLPIGLVLPNGLLAVHGGIPTRPDRSVQNVWENVPADEIPALLRSKRKEFSRNRFDGTAISGTKLKDFFSWLELINFSFAIEEAYGVKIRSCLRGHDHCDLCRHDWISNNLKEDKAPREKRERIKNVLTMTSISIVDAGERRLPGFQQQRFSYPSVAHWIPEESSPRVFSLMFDPRELASLNGFAESIHYEEKGLFVKSRMQSLRKQENDSRRELESIRAERQRLEEKLTKAQAKAAEEEKRRNQKKRSLAELQEQHRSLSGQIAEKEK